MAAAHRAVVMSDGAVQAERRADDESYGQSCFMQVVKCIIEGNAAYKTSKINFTSTK